VNLGAPAMKAARNSKCRPSETAAAPNHLRLRDARKAPTAASCPVAEQKD
jgi:hypothetical protein